MTDDDDENDTSTTTFRYISRRAARPPHKLRSIDVWEALYREDLKRLYGIMESMIKKRCDGGSTHIVDFDAFVELMYRRSSKY